MKIAAISIADYAEATEGMPHDAERLFLRMLLKMYSREAGLPDSDEENAVMFGYKTVRPYKRLKATLLKFPCGIYIEDDTIKHDRAEQEIAAAKSRREQAREHGRKGGLENGKKEPDEKSLDEVCPKFQESFVKVFDKLAQNFDETFSKPDAPIPIKTTTCSKTSPSPSPSPSEEIEAKASCHFGPKTKPGEIEQAFDAYNVTAAACGLPKASKLTKDRRAKIKARLSDYGFDGWMQALGNIEKSAFLTGNNERGWTASLDFLMSPAKFGKVHDGGYGNGRHADAEVSDQQAMQLYNELMGAAQ